MRAYGDAFTELFGSARGGPPKTPVEAEPEEGAEYFEFMRIHGRCETLICFDGLLEELEGYPLPEDVTFCCYHGAAPAKRHRLKIRRELGTRLMASRTS
jgi:hypothetical protein